MENYYDYMLVIRASSQLAIPGDEQRFGDNLETTTIISFSLSYSIIFIYMGRITFIPQVLLRYSSMI